jgi:hypothetical protein
LSAAWHDRCRSGQAVPITNTRTYVWDVTNLDAPSLTGTFTNSTPWRGTCPTDLGGTCDVTATQVSGRTVSFTVDGISAADATLRAGRQRRP